MFPKQPVSAQLSFTSLQVVQLTGISPRQLQWWDERGIVVPRRQGRRRLYFLDDVTEIAVICNLRSRGFSLQKVRKVVRYLQRELGRRLVETVSASSDFHLLTDGEHIFLQDSAQQIVDVLKNSRQPMLAVCLSDTVKRIRADIRKLPGAGRGAGAGRSAWEGRAIRERPASPRAARPGERKAS